MTIMNELLRDIKAAYTKLEQNYYGEFRGGTQIGEPGFCYTIHAQELYDKVLDLYHSYHPEFLNLSEIGDFKHTLVKEVAMVEYCYQESIKPKASQKKKDEVLSAINKANKQIKLDLFGLFKILEELQ